MSSRANLLSSAECRTVSNAFEKSIEKVEVMWRCLKLSGFNLHWGHVPSSHQTRWFGLDCSVLSFLKSCVRRCCSDSFVGQAAPHIRRVVVSQSRNVCVSYLLTLMFQLQRQTNFCCFNKLTSMRSSYIQIAATEVWQNGDCRAEYSTTAVPSDWQDVKWKDEIDRH